MATTIKLKNGSGAPLAGDLVQGEPAFDLTNKRLYTEDSGGSVIEVGTNPSTLTVDTNTLVVDAANNRVGIGTSSPNSTASAGPTLEISGTAGGNLVLSDSNATSGQRAKYLLSQGGALYVGHSADDGTSPVNDLVVNSSGDVGIGTASPNAQLHVLSSGNGEIDVERSGGALINLQAQTGVGVIGTDSNHGLRLKTNGTVQATITTSGNVGIGTTSPATPLHINGTTAAQIRSEATTGFAGLHNKNSSGNFYHMIDNSAGAGFSSGAYARVIYSDGAYPMAFYTNANERMRIDSSGRVGIGTASPARILHVENDGLADLLLRDTSSYSVGTGPAVIFQGKDSGGTTTQFGAIYGISNGSNSGELTFETRNSGSSAERMRIESNGDVGIGASDLSVYNALGSSRDFVVKSGGTTTCTIHSGTTNYGHLAFADGTTTANDEYRGLLQYYHGDNSMRLFTNASERMRIDSSGNVGIGTSSPSAVISSSKIAQVASSGNTTLSVTSTDSVNDRSAIVEILSSGNGNSKSIILYGDTDTSPATPSPLVFQGYHSGARTERMRINSTGSLILTGGGGTVTDTHGTASRTNLQLDGSSETIITFSQSGTTRGYLNATSNNFDLVAGTGSKLRFLSNGSASTAVTLDTSGNLLVGTSSLVGNSGRFQAVRSNTGAIGYFEVNNGGGAQNAVDITNAANAAFVPLRFWVNGYGGSLVGSISCTTSGTAFNATSDFRVKENIVDAPAGNIDAIRVRSFDWKADGTHQPYGMIAQELVEVAPEAVTQGKTEDDMWGVDYSKLVPMMIKEIQDLKAEVAALKGE